MTVQEETKSPNMVVYDDDGDSRNKLNQMLSEYKDLLPKGFKSRSGLMRMLIDLGPDTLSRKYKNKKSDS